jgi:hypothetical protein
MILLNFVIAVICDSFTNVMEKQSEALYKQRTRLNRESRYIIKVLYPKYGGVLDMFVLTTNSEAGQGGNSKENFKGFIHAAKGYFK